MTKVGSSFLFSCFFQPDRVKLHTATINAGDRRGVLPAVPFPADRGKIMLNITVKIEAGDLYDYMLRHSFNSPAGIVGSTFGAVLILFALATRQWMFLVLGLVMLLYLPWTLFLKSRRQVLCNPAFLEPLQYTLDEEGLTVSQGEEQAQMAWEDMHKAVSTSRSIILYTSRVNATLFPRRQLGDQKEALVEMISTHMPPGKVKIK